MLEEVFDDIQATEFYLVIRDSPLDLPHSKSILLSSLFTFSARR